VKAGPERGAKVAEDFPSRLVETSAGWILVEPELVPGQGEGAKVAVFGSDGWSIYGGVWPRKDREEPLVAMLADVCGIPLDEGERIAAEVLEEWRSRYGERARRVKRTVSLLTIVAGLVILLALLGVALAVWAFVS
jgi:hypothetical protein